MDVDPLSDTVPPRYNIESDDEEDEVRPLSVAPAPVNFDVRIVGNTPQGKGLLIATGNVGRRWGKGADLGEQSAAVHVNNVQIGLVFQPSWTQSTVIVSEALSALPLSAMHPYAKAILDAFKPKSLSLLDSYPVPTYATDAPVPFHEAPLRYLSTAEDTSFLNASASPFAPPNLVQSTSAAFLALASLPTRTSPTTVPATLLLLPAPHIPPPAPKDIAPSNIALLNQDDPDSDWPAALINQAQNLAFAALGEQIAHVWQLRDGVQKAKVAKRTTEIGEGGMYI